jgi:hypothetical protein
LTNQNVGSFATFADVLYRAVDGSGNRRRHGLVRVYAQSGQSPYIRQPGFDVPPCHGAEALPAGLGLRVEGVERVDVEIEPVLAEQRE